MRATLARDAKNRPVWPLAKFDGWGADTERESRSPLLAGAAAVSSLTPEFATQVVEACTANADELAGALGRAFDGQFVVKAGEPVAFEPASQGDLGGAGLVFAFGFGDERMLAVLPATAGIVPEWAKEPDITGRSKLNTLGQELSMLLVPESLQADSFETHWVDDLAAAIGRCQPSPGATLAPLEVAKGESLASLTLVWPVATAVFGDAAADGADGAAPQRRAGESSPTESSAEGGTSKVLRWKAPAPRDLRDLPPNVVSALRVKVPVSVNLAGKKIKLSEVIDIGPGSIITFDKACDAPLEVSVGGRPVATGEAVKVGERFGVRVQQMILPEETFRPMLPLTAR
jgi:flagellar motor switch/type III secretory pathway protein FliN